MSFYSLYRLDNYKELVFTAMVPISSPITTLQKHDYRAAKLTLPHI